MSAADQLIGAIQRVSKVIALAKEAQLTPDEEVIFDHIIRRFGHRKGFKITPEIDLRAGIAVEKLVVAGIITNDDCNLHQYLWTEKWKEIGYAD